MPVALANDVFTYERAHFKVLKRNVSITITRLCNIERFYGCKKDNFQLLFFTFFIFLLKIYIEDILRIHN